MNLTRVPPNEAESKHYLDSLLVSRFIPEGSSVLDIGTGPGFPAWLLAWCRPDLSVTAMDGSNKGLAFLREHALPNLDIVQARAEDRPYTEQFDLVTGRAVAPFTMQMELAARPLRIGGLAVPFRTPAEQDDIKRFVGRGLGLRRVAIHHVGLPGTDVVRLFPVFKKTRRTADEFPRPWGRIRANPLT